MQGGFGLEFRETLNDACAIAVDADLSGTPPQLVDTALAIPEDLEVPACGDGSGAARGVWYKVCGMN